MLNPTCLICISLTTFVELARTMQRGVYLNKSRLDLMHNRGATSMETLLHIQESQPAIHLISSDSVVLNVIAIYVLLFIGDKSTPGPHQTF